MSEVPSVKSQQDVVEVISYQEDMRRELEQVQTLQTFLDDAPLSLTGVDEVCTYVSLCNLVWLYFLNHQLAAV